MRGQTLRLPDPKFDYIDFEGGLDLVTPEIKTAPGTTRESQNYEIDINGGYVRCKGYERYDGQARPSDGLYVTVSVTITGTIAVGNTVTGLNSSAVGEVVAVVTSTTPNYLVLTKVLGTFEGPPDDAAEAIQVSAVTQATTLSGSTIEGASSAILHAQYRNLAADNYRADIGAVPGAGSVLGVWMMGDITYAFRNAADNLSAELYKSSAAGWVNVPLGEELAFTSGGTTEITEGQVLDGLVGGTPGQATITRVMLESGTWLGGDAAGKFIMASHTGTFEAGGVQVSGSGDLATITGNATAIIQEPNGDYEFVTYNFGGFSGAERIYGCDTASRGFEFDGSVFCPITTGMTVDKPTHVIAHENQLFFAFAGSGQHSGIGVPYAWSPVVGAGEIALGDNITAFQKQPGSEGNATLAIFTRNRINILYGTSVDDWNLVDYREEVGAYSHSVQEFGQTMMLDDRGVASLQTVQAYGNFQHDSLSRLIQPWVNERKINISSSCIARDKSQYRLFFSDGYALYVTTDNRKVIGMKPQLFDHPVTCSYSIEDSTGAEVLMFGSTDGYVYQMERGTSFDGNSIEAFFTTHYVHSKTPRWNKHYKSVVLEITGSGYADFNFTYELGYTSTDISQPSSVLTTAEFSSAKWDAFTWDAFTWDGQVLKPSVLKLSGSAENISLIVRSDSDYHEPLSFSGAQIRYLQRRQLR